MTERMTPNEARALLDGTTPGPWEPHPDYPTMLVNLAQKMAVAAIPGKPEDSTPEDEANLPLIAAAPDMAHTIAGMTFEYGVHWPATDDFPAWTSWGFDTIEKAREHNRELTVPPETPGTILRRYVTTPEEA